jgi:hypothetical protein
MFRSVAWLLAFPPALVLLNFLWSGRPQEAEEPPLAATGADQFQTAESSLESAPSTTSRRALRTAAAADGKWDYPRVRREFVRVLGRIQESPVVYEPFPHIEVHPLLSDDFYAALMAELPPVSEYKAAAYAGTAPTYEVLDTESFNTSTPVEVPEECRKKGSSDKRCFFKTRQLHEDGFTTGLVFKAGNSLERRYPLWSRMYELFYSLNFTRTLVEKFTLDDGKGIPAWKRAKWNLTHGSLKNSAALRIEPSHYHLAPHVDIMEKLITWQYFHPEDFSLADRKAGTSFYRPKPGVHMRVNDALNPQWMDYDLFEEVSEQRVLPNYFFSFAPGSRSWHGASIDPPQLVGTSEYSRRTFLGFITAGDTGFHPFRKPQGDVYLD